MTLLFILLFVLGPLLRQLGGGQQQEGRPGKPGPGSPRQPGDPDPGPREVREAPPQRPVRPAQQGPTQQTPAPQRPAQPGTVRSERSDAGSGSLQERLEEARRRVLEAMGEEPAAGSGRTAPARPAPSGTPQGGRRTVATPTTSSAPRQDLDWQDVVSPAQSFLPTPDAAAREAARREREEQARKRREQAARVRQKQRTSPARTARLPNERIPALGREGILNGIIWHEMLSPPVSKRGDRRTGSRLRSR